ncbi:LysR family transcriptional regulator [Shinella kummerowiae]|uniref:LysR family transcriptional regulator n=1 Tax=Shinella kummerowiae TaxID=417745 RepID=UPI0021B6BB98|nr:LysR family transcriptional regulator [Shinella kummerowiae]MCT7667465.1 LysR family transcriptional regulator [Shinella kummerowiae]
MPLTLRQIEYVVQAAKHGSISAACAELRISQSSVLAAIELAEQSAGVRIFDRRKGHGVSITPGGQKFLVSARRFLSAGTDFFASLDELANVGRHSIRVGCFSPLGALLIPPVLKRMGAETGEDEVILYEGDQVELRNWLAAGMLDLVVTYDIGEEYGTGITPICKVPAHALVHRDDSLADQETVSMAELSLRPLVLLDLPETRTYLLALFDFVARRPRLGLRTRSYETIRSAVSNGLGISVLNIRPNKDASPDGLDLRRIPISDALRQPTLLVADPYGDSKPGYVREFIRNLHGYISDLGPENFAVFKAGAGADLIYPLPDY